MSTQRPQHRREPPRHRPRRPRRPRRPPGLVDFDEAERHHSHAILQSPFPVIGYVSTPRVHAVPGHARRDARLGGTGTPTTARLV
ncbi:hypothetical protein ACIRRH_32840 [Kitasatospora sp. NPDC101235]|uniref:hypothetical protein n=1 Tax=Kitasatospora sp. NPDC101235 TaxID=3364101 RepID=UPI00380DAF0E